MQLGTSRVATDTNQELAQTAAPKPKLLHQVWQAIRARHYSKRTEKTYADWIKRFIFFHGKRHPLEMGERTRFFAWCSPPHQSLKVIPILGGGETTQRTLCVMWHTAPPGTSSGMTA